MDSRFRGNEKSMKVEIVPHDPSWKLKYAEEAARIKKACGEKILTIEHGGSTSIDGLGAKPILIFILVLKSLPMLTQWLRR